MALKTIAGVLAEIFVKFSEKYGFLKTLSYGVVICIFGLSVYSSIVIINLDERINKSVALALTTQTQQKEAIHQEGVVKRVENIHNINSIIKTTMYELGADRASIIEMHNGTNNTDGLPFLYGEMTYEQCRDGIEHVDDMYLKMNLTRYVFPLYLMSNNYFVGNMDEVRKIDDKIARKMESEGTKYVLVFGLHGVNNAIGYLAFTWNNTDNVEIGNSELSRVAVVAQKVSNLLKQY